MSKPVENLEDYPLSDDVRHLNGLSTGQGERHIKAQGNKYHAERTEYNGVTYHSKKEAKKAQDLDLMVKAGEIDFYLRQVPFTLQGGVVYKADFVTFSRHERPSAWTWYVTVIETKGVWTAVAKNKLKQFRAAYPNLAIEIC